MIFPGIQGKKCRMVPGVGEGTYALYCEEALISSGRNPRRLSEDALQGGALEVVWDWNLSRDPWTGR